MIQEDELLRKRYEELASKAYNNNQYTFTGFLSEADQAVFLSMERKLSFVHYEMDGGYEESTRKVLRFGNPEELGFLDQYPICCISIEPIIMKFGEELSHRDYLGAIMNLGIERSTLGDIKIDGKKAYIMCLFPMVDYILEHLDKVRHTYVKCARKDSFPGVLCDKREEVHIQVASFRLDGILAKVYNMSRNQSLILFSKKEVYVNGRVVENNSYQLKAGDVVSARGYGKFIFREELGKTKKDKFYLLIEKYI